MSYLTMFKGTTIQYDLSSVLPRRVASCLLMHHIGTLTPLYPGIILGDFYNYKGGEEWVGYVFS